MIKLFIVFKKNLIGIMCFIMLSSCYRVLRVTSPSVIAERFRGCPNLRLCSPGRYEGLLIINDNVVNIVMGKLIHAEGNVIEKVNRLLLTFLGKLKRR